MSTCNRLNLKTLGSQPIMFKYLPGHWSRLGDGEFATVPSFVPYEGEVFWKIPTTTFWLLRHLLGANVHSS